MQKLPSKTSIHPIFIWITKEYKKYKRQRHLSFDKKCPYNKQTYKYTTTPHNIFDLNSMVKP